ncbi:MAG: hypothetical protein ACTSU3_05005 [Candidatus Thorarchaeota archaeon]
MQVRRVVGTVLSLESNNESGFIVLETVQKDRLYLRCSLSARGYPPFVGEIIGVSYSVDQNELRITEIDRTPDQYMDPFGPDKGTMTRTYDDGYAAPKRAPDVRSDVRPDGISLIAALNLIGALLVGAIGFLFSLLPIIAPIGVLLQLLSGYILIITYGLWMYKDWGRVGMMIFALIGCFTIVGVVFGGPVIWYLNSDEIKNLYGAGTQSQSTYHDW